MGFLDKWFKKKKRDQLTAVLAQEERGVSVKKKAAVPRGKKAEETAGAVEQKQPKTETAKKAIGAESRAYAVLVRPIVSEKAALSENRGVYSFAVARGAGKTDIVQAVEDVYGIRPAAVRVMNFDGKTTRFGRQSGRRKDWKKAVVTLPQGKTINIHEGV